MLIIDGHDVYEIDEECIKKHRVKGECKVLEKLNADVSVNGILCQLPLPKHIDEDKVIAVSYTHLDVYKRQV